MKAKKTKAAKPMAKSVYKKGGSTKTKRQKSLDSLVKSLLKPVRYMHLLEL